MWPMLGLLSAGAFIKGALVVSAVVGSYLYATYNCQQSRKVDALQYTLKTERRWNEEANELRNRKAVIAEIQRGGYDVQNSDTGCSFDVGQLLQLNKYSQSD